MNWYTGDTTYDTVLTIGFVFAAFTIVSGFVTPTPYGRFASDSFGLNLHPKLGWWLMEIPATVVFAFFFVQISGDRASEVTPLVLGAIWTMHYLNRGWFFPLALRVVPGKKGSFSVAVIAAGMFVTAMHGYLNATWFTTYGTHLTRDWLTDPRFIVGLLIYLVGFALIVSSERIVRNLRPKRPVNNAGATEYTIPRGGGFRWVSSPTYLGELIAWTGFAILTWGLAGVVILLISAGNLIPRALATHRWYQEKFEEYPTERKALVPGIL